MLQADYCGHCQNAKKKLMETDMHKRVLVASASKELFQGVEGLSGIPALLHKGKVAVLGASPEFFERIAAAPIIPSEAHKKYQ